MINLFKKDDNPKIKVDDRLQHIAFIMDGNGRWAKKRHMPREYGHSVGAKVFKDITEYCGDIGINTVTVYAFSTENWKRPKQEIDALMDIFIDYIYEALRVMMEKDIHIRFLGDKAPLPQKVRELALEVEEKSKNNHRNLNIALNYGGKDEIVYAVNRCINEGITKITEADIEKRLYTEECPMPDLIVRTAGEMRLSNFLMWQSAYSEFIFLDTLWPDLKHEDIDKCIEEFYKRQRRYGGL